MQKKKNWIIIFILLISIIIVFLLAYLSSHITLNNASITGNTGGNLNNKGLFCEADGIVYFSNAYDNGTLYSMNPDETKLKRLNNVSVESINADTKRLYYYQNGSADGSGLGYVRKATGVYRCNLKGNNSLCLKRDSAGILSLCGNFLYYQHYTAKTGTYLDKIKIDKRKEATVLTQMVSPASVNEGTIYFAGMENDHYLYALDTTTDTPSVIWEHNLYNPIYQDGYIYFMDLETDYELHRYNLISGAEETLSTDRLDFFNVYGSMIYFQKTGTSEAALKRVQIDGSNEEIVAEGLYENVNITSQYAYFSAYDNKVPVYHQATFGPVNVTVFDAAAQAAIKK